jgi:hypothetical protein
LMIGILLHLVKKEDTPLFNIIYAVRTTKCDV